MIKRPEHNNLPASSQKITTMPGTPSGANLTDVSLAGISGDQEPSKRVDSWKHIANYFRRDVRTVQRWERQEGLPVHRHSHRKSSSVYALRGELNAWWNSRDISNDPAELENRRRSPVRPRSTQSFTKDNSEKSLLLFLVNELVTAMLVEVKNEKAKGTTRSRVSALFPVSQRPPSPQHQTPRASPKPA